MADFQDLLRIGAINPNGGAGNGGGILGLPNVDFGKCFALQGSTPFAFVNANLQIPIAAALNQAGLVKNAAAARDLLGAGSVKVDGQVVDRAFILKVGVSYICQAGKKAFARVELKG